MNKKELTHGQVLYGQSFLGDKQENSLVMECIILAYSVREQQDQLTLAYPGITHGNELESVTNTSASSS